MGCKCSNNKPEEDKIIKGEKKKTDFSKPDSNISKDKNKDNQNKISNTDFKKKKGINISSKNYVKKEKKKKTCFYE